MSFFPYFFHFLLIFFTSLNRSKITWNAELYTPQHTFAVRSRGEVWYSVSINKKNYINIKRSLLNKTLEVRNILHKTVKKVSKFYPMTIISSDHENEIQFFRNHILGYWHWFAEINDSTPCLHTFAVRSRGDVWYLGDRVHAVRDALRFSTFRNTGII